MNATPAPEPRFETYSDQSPDSGSTPFWLDACVRMLKPGPRGRKNPAGADKVLTVAKTLDADRVKVAGDDATEMNRADIAAVAGYDPDRPDSASWIVTFLQEVGYLRVQKCYEPGTGTRGADRFVVSPRPPLNYVGPRTQHGLLRALRMRKEWSWPDLFGPENPREKPVPSGDGVEGESIPSGDGVDPENPREKPVPSGDGVEGESIPSGDGVDPENPREKPVPSGDGAPRAGAFMSSLSLPPSGRSGETDRREGGGTISARPDGASATPPADAGAGDDALNTQVRNEVVRQLPWRQKHHALSVSDENHVAAAITTAIRTYGLTFETAREHALYKLDRATVNPVGYVARGFQPENLPAPVSDDPLPLPSAEQDRSSAPTQPAAAVESELPPWCGECGDGDARAEVARSLRRFYDETAGRTVPCACSRPGWQHNSAA